MQNTFLKTQKKRENSDFAENDDSLEVFILFPTV